MLSLRVRILIAGLAVAISLPCWPLGEEVQSFEHDRAVQGVTFSGDGQWVGSWAVTDWLGATTLSDKDRPKVWHSVSGAQRVALSGYYTSQLTLSRDASRAVANTRMDGPKVLLYDGMLGSSLRLLEDQLSYCCRSPK